MKLFPPSPKNKERTISYVESLPKRNGQSDYHALSSLMTSCFTIGTMMFIYGATTAGNMSIFRITLTAFFLVFAIYLFITALRLTDILRTFDNGQTINDAFASQGE